VIFVSVLTFKSDEFKTFPPILREYASYISTIKGNSEKTVCEYLLDLRPFFRFYISRSSNSSPDRDEFERISISDIGLNDVKAVTSADIIEFFFGQIKFLGVPKPCGRVMAR
jgi:hypothetical protein